MIKGLTTAGLLAAIACGPCAWAQDAGPAQAAAPLPPPAVVEPVLDADVFLSARQTTAYRDGGVQVLLLDGDVSVAVGAYGFRARQAVVRIEQRDTLGKPTRDIAIYFDQAASNGNGGVRAEGQGLLVTVATRGKVEVTSELKLADALPEAPIVGEALARYTEYRQRLGAPTLRAPRTPISTPEQDRLRAERRAAIERDRRTITLPGPGQTPADEELVGRPVLPTRGTVRYGSVDRIVWDRKDPNEDAIILIGGVRLLYEDADEGRDVLLTAERIVIFLDKDDSAAASTQTQVDAGRVRGVYLEDNAVVTDGTSTVRAPRAYYDLRTDRAMLLDAVVYSYDTDVNIPLYMRADLIRQTSADTFSAEDARFTTSEFGKPHLSIGASRITLEQSRTDAGDVERWVTAEGLTLRSGDTPFFYWPIAQVEANSVPIRRVKVGYESDNGAQFQTAWDLFALAGVRAPKGVELLGEADYRGEHGLGLGLDMTYDRDAAAGWLRGYFLPSDSGEDEIAERADVSFDDETRGFFHAQHRQELPAGWELWLEAGHVSDPTFLEEFFPDQAYAARPYETSAYFKKAEDDWALTGLIKGQTNHFTPQYSELLTPGYSVDKLPEAEYRLATSVFEDTATFYHESRLGNMRAVFGQDSPGDRGFNAAQSAALFGIAPGTSFDAAAAAAGFPRQTVTRFDTRNELALPLRAGAVDVTPFVVGRVTAYDTDFAAFNGGENDQARLWGGFGVEASTELSRTYNGVNSVLFDVQGLRHIIEPGVTLAFYDGTIDSSALPVYDPDVERLAEGGVFRFGVVNTLQTRRGGPGRSRSVDWIKLRTDVVLRTEDSSNATALPRYYDHRPEYALGDDHFYGELLWAVTEATAITGEVTHNFDEGSVVQWRAGIENKHTDRLSTYVNYREIDAIDARLLGYGASLQLTTKHRVGLYHVLDFGEGNSRTISLAIDRKMPRATVQLVIGYDDLDGEATASIVLTPDGGGSGGFFGGGLR